MKAISKRMIALLHEIAWKLAKKEQEERSRKAALLGGHL
jgi:hypothetical protein